jgi:hypothetical protein
MSLDLVLPFLFPLPPPPPSIAVFLPLGSSYLPDDLAPTAFSLFFCLFLGSLVWVFWHSAIRGPLPAVGLSCAPTASSIHRLLQLRCFGQIASRLPYVFANLLRAGFDALHPLLGFFRAPTETSFHRSLLCTRSAYTRSVSFPVFFFCLYSVMLLFFFLYFVCYLLVIML